MVKMEFLYGLLLLPFLVVSMPSNAGTQSYQALSVQNVDSKASGSTGGFLDVAIALLPQIESLVKNVTQNATTDSMKEARRFQDVIKLFIPFMRKTMEFQAEDEGRILTPDDFQILDEIELGLSYISTLTEDAVNTLPEETVFLPDYTDLVDIPDFNIPSLNIPESEIPDITIPEIDVPGGSRIPERKIPLRNIPEINIPGRTVPVTNAPSTLRQTAGKRKEVRIQPLGSPEIISVPGRIIPVTKAPSTLRQTGERRKEVRPLGAAEGTRLRKTSRGQLRPVRMPSITQIASSPSAIVHSLPGGGYSYSVINAQ